MLSIEDKRIAKHLEGQDAKIRSRIQELQKECEQTLTCTGCKNNAFCATYLRGDSIHNLSKKNVEEIKERFLTSVRGLDIFFNL